MKKQNGFTIIENLVAMSVMSIAAFGYIASTVTAITMKKTGVERTAAARAADTAVNPVFYLRGDRASLINEIASFPKVVNEKETRKDYTVSIAALQDHSGATVTTGSLPAHGILLMTVNVPYTDKIGASAGGALNKSVSPTYTVEF